MKPYKKVDVLIIGAGPAGTIASAYLKNQGFDVVIIEKQKFPRYVIGESLLPRTLDHLEEVGLLEDVKKANFQLKKGPKFYFEGKECEFPFDNRYTEGHTYAWNVPRDVFDKVLADGVQKKGVNILYEHIVEHVEFKENYQLTKIIDSKNKPTTIESKFVIDASGYGRVLPKQLNLNIPSSLKARSSIYTQIRNNFRPNIENQDIIFIESINNKESWIWLIPFNNGNTSVGIVGDEKWINSFKTNPEEKFKKIIKTNKMIDSLFEDIEFVFDPIISTGYSIGAKKLYGNGFVLVGNTTEFLDPVFSSGVMLATETGLLGAKLVAKELKGETVDWEKQYSEIVTFGIKVFRSYIDAWYDGTLHTIFFTDKIRNDFKKQITSVLGGYIFDMTNPFVKKHNKILKSLAKVIKIDTNKETV